MQGKDEEEYRDAKAKREGFEMVKEPRGRDGKVASELPEMRAVVSGASGVIRNKEQAFGLK